MPCIVVVVVVVGWQVVTESWVWEVCSLVHRRLAGPVGVHLGCGILVGKIADQMRRAVEFCEAILHFGLQLLCNVVGEDDLAVGGVAWRGAHVECEGGRSARRRPDATTVEGATVKGARTGSDGALARPGVCAGQEQE